MPGTIQRLIKVAGALTVVLCSLGLTGCGGDNTYRVTGKVTFNGKPVPAGTVQFMPDGSKGNSGTAGYAKIVNGVFDTSADGGRGVGKGAQIVSIEGFDPAVKAKTMKGETSGEDAAQPLFTRFTVTLEVTGSMEKDFEVPQSAARAPVIGDRRPDAVVP